MRPTSQCVMLALLALLAFPFHAAGESPEAPKRLPVPPSEAQRKSLDIVKDLFRTEYASTSATAQRALALRLFAQARTTTDDPAGQFILLKESAAVAGKAGATLTAYLACRELVKQFDVKPGADWLAQATVLAAGVTLSEEAKMLIAYCRADADALAAADDYDTADALLAAADRAAVKMRDQAASIALRKKRQELTAGAAKAKQIAPHMAKLKDAPDDAEANLAVGEYACFVKGDWPRGLAHLAKGSDMALKKLALQELGKPAEAAAMAELAGGWWDAAKAASPVEKAHMQLHAAAWYGQARPQLTGFAALTAEQRIKQAAEAAAAAGIKPAAPGQPGQPAQAKPRTVDLLKHFDSKRVVYGEWAIEKDGLRNNTVHLWPRVTFPYEPPEEFDLAVTVVQPRIRYGIVVQTPGGMTFSFGQQLGVSPHVDPIDPGTKAIDRAMGVVTLKPDEPYTAVLKVRKTKISMLMNGKLAVEFDPRGYKPRTWQFQIKDDKLLSLAVDFPGLVTKVEVTEVTGTGKIIK